MFSFQNPTPLSCYRCAPPVPLHSYEELRAHLRAVHKQRFIQPGGINLFETYPNSRFDTSQSLKRNPGVNNRPLSQQFPQGNAGQNQFRVNEGASSSSNTVNRNRAAKRPKLSSSMNDNRDAKETRHEGMTHVGTNTESVVGNAAPNNLSADDIKRMIEPIVKKQLQIEIDRRVGPLLTDINRVIHQTLAGEIPRRVVESLTEIISEATKDQSTSNQTVHDSLTGASDQPTETESTAATGEQQPDMARNALSNEVNADLNSSPTNSDKDLLDVNLDAIIISVCLTLLEFNCSHCFISGCFCGRSS